MSLLDDRVKEYGLPKCPYQPAFDRFVLYTLPEKKAERETFVEGGMIFKLNSTNSREKKESPRGIVMAAGLKAMDIMRSHGIRLGSIVWVARFSPWRHVVERTERGEIEMMFLRVSDIVGSEDVLTGLSSGAIKVALGEDGLHRYQYENEAAAPRFDPLDFEDQ